MTNEDVLAHPVTQVMMEVVRLRAQLSVFFAEAYAGTELSRMELAVLIAVSAAPMPPTVPQIGRSVGHARQVIQKAANKLFAAGLLETIPNPHHKRADLLKLTDSGIAVTDKVLRQGGEIAERVMHDCRPGDWKRLAEDLQNMRKSLGELIPPETEPPPQQ